MSTWGEVEAAAGELAADVQRRFEATGLGLLATVRADGSPRISPIEPSFWDGQLWLGSMPDSRKATDLRREPRFALHAATADKDVADGDAKVAGRATLVEDLAVHERFAAHFKEATGYGPEPGTFDLFTADVIEMSFLKPAGDHLDIRIWTPARGVQLVERR